MPMIVTAGNYGRADSKGRQLCYKKVLLHNYMLSPFNQVTKGTKPQRIFLNLNPETIIKKVANLSAIIKILFW